MRNPLRALFERRMDSHGLLELMRLATVGVTGRAVTEDTALRIATVLTCVSLRSRTLASLPVGVYERVDERTRKPRNDHWLAKVLSQPNSWQTTFEFTQVMSVYQLLYRNAFAWINWVDDPLSRQRRAVELIPLHPSKIVVTHDNLLQPPTYKLRTTRGDVDIPAKEILHIKDLATSTAEGRPTLYDGRDVISLAQVQQEHAGTFWSNGGRPDVLLKHPRILKDTTKKGLEESWAATYGGSENKRRVAVLEDGMDALFPNVSNEASQFLETKSSTRAEIAAMFHVPAFLAGLEEKQTSWGTGVEQMKNGFATFAVQPDCENWEDRYGATFLKDEPTIFVKFSLQALLRGDSKSWGDFVRTMREIGVLNANEVRALLDLNPRAGGDDYDDLAYASGRQGKAGEGQAT